MNGLWFCAAGAEDSVRPRRLSGRGGRPLNFTVSCRGSAVVEDSLADRLVDIFASLGSVYGSRMARLGAVRCASAPDVADVR